MSQDRVEHRRKLCWRHLTQSSLHNGVDSASILTAVDEADVTQTERHQWGEPDRRHVPLWMGGPLEY